MVVANKGALPIRQPGIVPNTGIATDSMRINALLHEIDKLGTERRLCVCHIEQPRNASPINPEPIRSFRLILGSKAAQKFAFQNAVG